MKEEFTVREQAEALAAMMEASRLAGAISKLCDGHNMAVVIMALGTMLGSGEDDRAAVQGLCIDITAYAMLTFDQEHPSVLQ